MHLLKLENWHRDERHQGSELCKKPFEIVPMIVIELFIASIISFLKNDIPRFPHSRLASSTSLELLKTFWEASLRSASFEALIIYKLLIEKQCLHNLTCPVSIKSNNLSNPHVDYLIDVRIWKVMTPCDLWGKKRAYFWRQFMTSFIKKNLD